MGKHILIINRWIDDFGQYDEYIDHKKHRVSYITIPSDQLRFNQSVAEAVEMVDDLSRYDHVVEVAKQLAVRFGHFDHVLALSEYDIALGGYVRDRLSIQSGSTYAQAVTYVDKVKMKAKVAKARIPIPKYTSLGTVKTVGELKHQYKLPVILKPKVGAASQGVEKVTEWSQLSSILRSDKREDYEIETHLAGPIYHVDGFVKDGGLVFHTISRYINSCLDFNSGLPLGSVILDEPVLKLAITCMTCEVLRSLELHTGAFHLELISDHSGNLYFLEIGARVGGGEIPFLAKNLYGLNLMRLWVDLELNESIAYLNRIEKDKLGGFLMIPSPRNIPCVVMNIIQLSHHIPGILSEVTPPIGYVFQNEAGYDNLSGRYHFSGDSTKLIEQVIYQVCQEFCLSTRSLTEEAVL